MKYSSVITLNLANAYGAAVHVFRANGLYDPDYTSVGGHQPFGRDKHVDDFRKYIVTSSFISATWCNTVGALVDCGMFYLVSSDTYQDVWTNFTANGIDYMSESNDCKQRAYWGDPNNKKSRCYARWKCPHPFDDDWGAEATGDPTANNQQYFTLLAHTVPQSKEGPQEIFFRVEIFYRVLWFDPRLVNSSS